MGVAAMRTGLAIAVGVCIAVCVHAAPFSLPDEVIPETAFVEPDAKEVRLKENKLLAAELAHDLPRGPSLLKGAGSGSGAGAAAKKSGKVLFPKLTMQQYTKLTKACKGLWIARSPVQLKKLLARKGSTHETVKYCKALFPHNCAKLKAYSDIAVHKLGLRLKSSPLVKLISGMARPFKGEPDVQYKHVMYKLAAEAEKEDSGGLTMYVLDHVEKSMT